jgi:hypothetical protein
LFIYEAVLLIFVFTGTKHNTYFRYHHPKQSKRNFIVTFINKEIAKENTSVASINDSKAKELTL